MMSTYRDTMREAEHMAAMLTTDRVAVVGFGVVHLIDGDGRTKQLDPFANLVTTAGDQYMAQKIVTGIGPAAPSAPTAANGMKLGTGSTAVTKSSTAAALITYLTASNVAFDSGFATSSAVGGDAGWLATYKTTWVAGVATNAAITEVAIVNDQATNATSTAANTYSRALITSVNKLAGDALAITWNWKLLGA